MDTPSKQGLTALLQSLCDRRSSFSCLFPFGFSDSDACACGYKALRRLLPAQL